jgi:hypothetical protein
VLSGSTAKSIVNKPSGRLSILYPLNVWWFRLLRGRSDGTFLIRNSTNFPDGFTLCVAFNGKVEHYRVYLINNNQYTCDHDEFFDNLIQLVSVSFQTNSFQQHYFLAL